MAEQDDAVRTLGAIADLLKALGSKGTVSVSGWSPENRSYSPLATDGLGQLKLSISRTGDAVGRSTG